MRIGRLTIGRTQDIYLQPINGLGNRLRAIQSLYKLALHTNRKLKIHWGPSEGFSTEAFEDLFDTSNLPENMEFITEHEFFQARSKFICLDSYVRQNIDTNYYVRDKEVVLDALLYKSFCLTTSSCIEFMLPFSEIKNIYKLFKYNCWVSSLRPTKALSERIEKVTSKFDKNTIGIHIRKGDAAIGPWKDHYAVSKDCLFYDRIRKHKGKVFVATDCPETEKDLIRNFGDKIIVCEDKEFVAPGITISDAKPNQADALVDMYCLAATQKLYGTNWSTFSVIAAQFTDIPLEKVGTGKDKKEKIGIVTGAMNREEMIKVSLASWLHCSEVSEIIIVDWSSKNSLTYLENMDPRIKVIRVENQKYFNQGKAFNLGFTESSCDKILKLDVDYILNPYYDIFKSGIKLTKENFITGNWRDKHLDNGYGFISHLNGFIYVYRDIFFHAGGYSNFENYGYDDDDLYNKLEAKGYKREFLDLTGDKYIYHNPHDDSSRTEHYEIKDVKESHKINRTASNKAKK